jgi:four helix bundle protein
MEKRRVLPERSFKFALAIIDLCRKLDEKPGVSRTLSNQLLRSGTSVGANIEEGQGSQSRADFLSKYSIACKEARETLHPSRLTLLNFIFHPSPFSLRYRFMFSLSHFILHPSPVVF